MTVAIVWFRRDLRVCDQLALSAALQQADQVIPVFCLDRRLLRGRHRSGVRTQFMIECLRDLAGSLHERGSGLVILDGRPERELPKFAHRLGARAVHATADVGPFSRRRDAVTKGATGDERRAAAAPRTARG